VAERSASAHTKKQSEIRVMRCRQGWLLPAAAVPALLVLVLLPTDVSAPQLSPRAGQQPPQPPQLSQLAARVRMLEAENARLRAQYGLPEMGAAEPHAKANTTGWNRRVASANDTGTGSAAAARRRRVQVDVPEGAPEVPEVPSAPEMPSVDVPAIPGSAEDLLPSAPPAPPCEDPENCDCLGGWSACSAGCETAAQRVWTEARTQTGTGASCPTATDCGLFGLQDGECAAKPYNASACRLPSGEPCPDPPVGFAGTIMRLIPMASAMFVAYFGNKISTMVRVCSVFCASCTPVLMPVIEQIKSEGRLSAATFVGVGGAIYAGALGSFAAVKKREFGIMVQGVAVGYVVSSVVQGFLIGMLLEQVPSAKNYLEWITMIFTFVVGGTIGKLSQKYEDVVSIGATAAMGAYVQLQTFSTLGYSFTRNLSIQAAAAGEFGCTDWKCEVTLGFFVLYGALGARNQIMMGRMQKKIEEDPDFPGEGLYQQTLVRLNGAMAIVFQLNELVKEQGKFHTEEELEELLNQNINIVIKLATVFSDAGLLVLSVAMFAGIIEGFVNGVFYGAYLQGFAGALGVIAGGLLGLVLYAIHTHRLPHAEMAQRHARMKIYLVLVALLIPVVAGCGLVVMVMMPGTSVSIPQVQRFFDMDTLPVDVQRKLGEHLPTVYQTLIGALFTLSVSWSIVCKHLGGILYLAMKLMSMVVWSIVAYGAAITFAGFYGAAHVGLLDGMDEMKEKVLANNISSDDLQELADLASSETTLFHMLGGIGIVLILTGLWGVIGMRLYYKIRSIGRIVLRVFFFMLLGILLLNLTLFGICAYYYSQMEERLDADWYKVERRYGNTSSWGFILDKVAPSCANIAPTPVYSHSEDSAAGGGGGGDGGGGDGAGGDGGGTMMIMDGYASYRGRSACAKATFEEKVHGSFNVMLLSGGVIVLVLVVGVVTSHYIVVTDNPIPGKVERAGGKTLKGDKEPKLSRKEKKAAKKADTRSKSEKKADKLKEKAEKKEKKAKDKAEKLRLKQEVLEQEAEKKKSKKKAKAGLGGGDGDDDSGKGDGKGDGDTVTNPVAADDDKAGAGKTFEKEKKKNGKNGKKGKGGKVAESADESNEKKRLLAIWQSVDTDGSGSLDRAEAKTAMEAMGQKMSDQEFQNAMTELDDDGSGEISFDEFIVWWQKQDAEAQQQLIALNALDFSSFADEV
jgi:hypothetical protein